MLRLPRGPCLQAKVDDDSDGELDGDSDGGGEGEGGPLAASQPAAGKKPGKRKLAQQDGDGDDAGGADDNYDHDDPFIDDGEMVELIEADVKKPKHGGFFINKVTCARQPRDRAGRATRGVTGAECNQPLPAFTARLLTRAP